MLKKAIYSTAEKAKPVHTDGRVLSWTEQAQLTDAQSTEREANKQLDVIKHTLTKEFAFPVE